LEEIIKSLKDKFGEIVEKIEGTRDMPTIKVPSEKIIEIGAYLKDKCPISFEQLTDITCVDELPKKPRFKVVYHILSLSKNQRLRIVTYVDEETPEIDSVTGIWAGANWLEREAYDMFGIKFKGHPDLKRILMPFDYEHHPLRKDFPVRGIDPGKLYKKWDRERKA